MEMFMIGMVVGSGIFSVVIAISMAKAAKWSDETETEILTREVGKNELES